MRSRTLRCFALAAALALPFYGATAFAQEASEADIAQARQLGTQAQQAFEQGKYPESEKLWAAAQKLYPKAPTLSLGLARAAAKNGHYVLAQEHYKKIIREWNEVASPPPAFKDALEAAKNEVDPVSKKIASVVIKVEGAAAPTVTIDGAPVHPETLGLPRPVDPGEHTVHAEAAGYKPGDTKFTVAEAGNAEAKLTLEKAPDAPVAGGVGGDAPKGSSNKTLAVVAFGVGGAGLLVGAITGFIALGKHSDLNDACPGGTCANDKQSDVDSYKTMGTISTVGFIVAGVGAAAGAVLWFTAPKETAQNGSSHWATVSPYLGVGNAGVAGRF
jgi:hypothetical protein